MPNSIPKNFFLYWSGQDFQYVNYICVLSLIKSNAIVKCEVYYEEEPVDNPNWDMLKKLEGVRLIKLNFDGLFELAQIDKADFSAFFNKAYVAEKSDLFRLLILYCYGGVYLDFDCLVLRDFSPLLDTEIFAGVETHRRISVVNNAVLGAVKKCHFLKVLITNISNLYTAQSRPDGWGDLGPKLFTRMLCPRSVLEQIAMKFIKYQEKHFPDLFLNNIWAIKLLNKSWNLRKI